MTLKKKDKILDIGSGYGPLLELVKNEYDIVGLEPNARNYKISKKMGHNVLNTFLKNTFKPKTFKAIISLFTLTYITNFDQMLKTIKKFSKIMDVFFLECISTNSQTIFIILSPL